MYNNMSTDFMNQRQALEQKYKNARLNLLLVVVFSLVNLVFALTESEVYFLFSASTPLFVLFIFKSVALEYGNNLPIVAGAIVSVAIVGVYFVCWLFSKKYHTLLLVSAVLFLVDCLVCAGLLLGSELNASSIIDVAFHVYVTVCLFNGAITAKKLNALGAQNDAMMQPEANNPWEQAPKE